MTAFLSFVRSLSIHKFPVENIKILNYILTSRTCLNLIRENIIKLLNWDLFVIFK